MKKLVKNRRRMASQLKHALLRIGLPKTSTVFLTSFMLLLAFRHIQRSHGGEGERVMGKMSILSSAPSKYGFSNRKILSGAEDQQDQMARNRDSAAANESFFSLIPSKKIFTVNHQQAWVKITMPPHSKRSRKSKEIATMHSSRRMQLRKACRASGNAANQKWLDNAQLIAAPERRLVVCYVQKAGSTSWHKLVYNLRHNYSAVHKWTNEGHIENRNVTRDLDDVTKAALTQSRQATRVLCVRHPFARLISGWNNKFHRTFVANVGNLMFRTMPGLTRYTNMTSQADADHVISFEDFVQYLADHGLDKADPHFKTVGQLCRPCEFPYDFIVKAESAPSDLWWLLNRINATMDDFLIHNANAMTRQKIGLDQKTPSHGGDPQQRVFSAIVRHFFSRVPRETIRRLMALYYEDFARFGYTFDIETLSSGGFR